MVMQGLLVYSLGFEYWYFIKMVIEMGYLGSCRPPCCLCLPPTAATGHTGMHLSHGECTLPTRRLNITLLTLPRFSSPCTTWWLTQPDNLVAQMSISLGSTRHGLFYEHHQSRCLSTSLNPPDPLSSMDEESKCVLCI